MQQSIHTAYAYSLIGSVLFGAVGFVLTPAILSCMRTPAELMTDSILYLRIYFAGIVFIFIFNIGSGILRALGDSKKPLYALIICCFMNIFLDFLLVVVFPMGVAGAALATMLSQAVSAVLITVFLMLGAPDQRLVLRNIRCHRHSLQAQLYVGVPDGLQSVMYAFANLVIQAAVNSYGSQTVAAWAAEAKIEAFFWMISGAYCVATTTFVGQNYGARKYDRIVNGTRVSLLLHQATSVIISVLFFIFARQLLGIFSSDPEVIRIGIFVLRTVTPFYALFSFVEILASSLRGMGDVVIPMLLTLFGVCILRIVWTLFVLPIYPQMLTLTANYPITWITTSILFIIYYFWRKKHGLFPA